MPIVSDVLKLLGSGIRDSFSTVQVPVRISVPTWTMQVPVPRSVARDKKVVVQMATDMMVERINEIYRQDPEAFSVYVDQPLTD